MVWQRSGLKVIMQRRASYPFSYCPHFLLHPRPRQVPPDSHQMVVEHWEPVKNSSTTLTREEAHRLANKLFLKVADLAALEGDYQRAITNYEKVAHSSVDNNLMKWSVKEYFLKAGICHLASQVTSLFPLSLSHSRFPGLSPVLLYFLNSAAPGFPSNSCGGLRLFGVWLQDMVATQRALSTYRDLDPTFPSTREHQLLVDLNEACEQGDQEAFADKLFQYDQLSKLDKWKTTILLRVKEGIAGKEGEDEFA